MGSTAGILWFYGFYQRDPLVLWVLPEESSGFVDFTRGIIWFYEFYQRDLLVLGVLAEGSSGLGLLTKGSSGLDVSAEGSSGFMSFFTLGVSFLLHEKYGITLTLQFLVRLVVREICLVFPESFVIDVFGSFDLVTWRRISYQRASRSATLQNVTCKADHVGLCLISHIT